VSTKPVITPRDAHTWELAADFGIIPRGFVTDGASVPRFFWRILGSPMEPRTCAAAIRHDYAYQTGALSRREADDCFYCDLRASGVRVPRAYLYWLGVRLFGWLHYHNNKGET
jgi:hypothetical protein